MIASTHVAVSCRNVVKEFGDGDSRLRVLHGIDLDVREGEMTLLVGPSGCGKTTLISIIADLLDPTEGEISLFGTRQSQLPRTQRIQFRARNIGFVFQQYNLLPSLSAVENVAIPLLINGWKLSPALRKAQTLIDAVGLENRAHSYPSQLSGGQQQRVAIARSLVHDPKLLVCDEPTAALDAHTGHIVMDLIKRVAVQTGRAVIVVTHDSRVFEFGDRIARMDDGRIIGLEELRQHPSNSDSANDRSDK
jgi:putative ABC transport system ATP-binding protein